MNIGCRSRLDTKLEEKYPWLLNIWCICHWWKGLAVQNVFSKYFFSDTEACKVHLFYIYKICPKKVSCLNELSETLEGIEEPNDDEVDHSELYIYSNVSPLKTDSTWVVFNRYNQTCIHDTNKRFPSLSCHFS